MISYYYERREKNFLFCLNLGSSKFLTNAQLLSEESTKSTHTRTDEVLCGIFHDKLVTIVPSSLERVTLINFDFEPFTTKPKLIWQKWINNRVIAFGTSNRKWYSNERRLITYLFRVRLMYSLQWSCVYSKPNVNVYLKESTTKTNRMLKADVRKRNRSYQMI